MCWGLMLQSCFTPDADGKSTFVSASALVGLVSLLEGPACFNASASVGTPFKGSKCFSVLVLSFTMNRNVQRNHRLIYGHSHIGCHHGFYLVSICSHFLFQGLIKTVSIIFTFSPVRTGSSQCWKHNYKCISAKEKPLPAAEAVRTTIALAYWYKRYLHTST